VPPAVTLLPHPTVVTFKAATPLSEYEVSSTALTVATLTPTASPQMTNRHLVSRARFFPHFFR
jgi:hypothetical protein